MKIGKISLINLSQFSFGLYFITFGLSILDSSYHYENKDKDIKSRGKQLFRATQFALFHQFVQVGPNLMNKNGIWTSFF